MKKKLEYIYEHKFNSNIKITINAYTQDEAITILASLISNIFDYRHYN